MVLLGNI